MHSTDNHGQEQRDLLTQGIHYDQGKQSAGFCLFLTLETNKLEAH